MKKILFIFTAMVVVAVGTAFGLSALLPPQSKEPLTARPITLEQVLQQTLIPAPIPPGNELTPLSDEDLREPGAENPALSEDLSDDFSEDLDVALAEDNVEDLESLYQASLDEPAAVTPTAAPSPEPTAQPTPTPRPVVTATAAPPAPTPTAVAAVAPTPRVTPPAATPRPSPRVTPPPAARPAVTRPAPTAAAAPAESAWWAGSGSNPDRLAVAYVGSAAYTHAIVVLADGPFADAAATGRHLRVLRDGQPVKGTWQISPQNPQMLVFPVEAVGDYELGIAEGLVDRNGRRYGVSRSGPVRVR